MIPIRQAKVLPPTSFRFPVTRNTLAFGYILPTAGLIRSLHPLERAPAGRTTKRMPPEPRRHSCLNICLVFADDDQQDHTCIGCGNVAIAIDIGNQLVERSRFGFANDI